MFKSLQLINYEGHKNTILNFHPGVNIILGENDQGKSSLFRAIEWIWKNRPLDNDYRPYWIKPNEITKVILELIEGKKIIRERSDSVNRYIIGNDKFTAFKQNVPQDVQTLLNMDNINIQPQMSSIFLLSNTSGEVARYLNNITNLDDIDIAQSYIKREKEQINNYLSNQNHELKSLELQLEEYNDIDSLEEKVIKLENLEKKRNQGRNILRQINDINISLHNKEIDLKKHKEILKHKDKIKKLEKFLISKEKRIRLLEEYDILVEKINHILFKLDEYKDFFKTKEKINRLIELSDGYSELLLKKENVQERYNEIENTKKLLLYKKEILKSIKNNLLKYGKEYKNKMGKECILCGAKINETNINSISR